MDPSCLEDERSREPVGETLYREACERTGETLPELAPTGQLVLAGFIAQLGFDGVAYAPVEAAESPEPEPDAEDGATGRQLGLDDRQLWLDGLESETRLARERLAAHHDRRALQADSEGKPSTRDWHRQRARGQRERFQRIRSCGGRVLVRTLQCGCHVGRWQQTVPIGCADWRACPTCRGKRVRKYRAKFARACEYWRERYRFGMRNGRYSERFLTLTAPHEGTAGERQQALKKAWPRFLRQLKRHLEVDKGIPKNQLNFPFLAALETTAGDDADGHPHIHAWLISPYIPQELLRLYWARALPTWLAEHVPTRPLEDVLADHEEQVYRRQRKKGGRDWRERARRQAAREREELESWLVTRRGPQGRPLEEVPWPVLHVRRAKDAVNELVKYLVKEMYIDGESGELVYLDASLAAEIYNGYAGIRALWASRGFWQERREIAHCPRCGSCDWHIEIFERSELEEIRVQRRDTS